VLHRRSLRRRPLRSKQYPSSPSSSSSFKIVPYHR
jgi:hypothetical protein